MSNHCVEFFFLGTSHTIKYSIYILGNGSVELLSWVNIKGFFLACQGFFFYHVKRRDSNCIFGFIFSLWVTVMLFSGWVA